MPTFHEDQSAHPGSEPGILGPITQRLRTIRHGSLARVLLVSTIAFAFVAASVLTPQGAVASPMKSLPSASILAAASDCPDILFIGARGSGEPDAMGGVQSGLGPEVDSVFQQMKADLSNKVVPSLGRTLTAKDLFVVYQAVHPTNLTPSEQTQWNQIPKKGTIRAPFLAAFGAMYATNHVETFLASVNEGITSAMDELTTEASQCPNMRFVLAGFSQGAMVMHELLLRLSDPNNSEGPAYLRRIVATVLIADPAKVSRSNAMRFGSAPASAQGIRTFFKADLRVQPIDVPTPSSTYDICNKGDLVCDTSWSTFGNYGPALDIHTNSYRGNKTVIATGSKIAKTILGQLPGVVDHLSITPASATIAAGTPQKYLATAINPFNVPFGDVTSESTFGISPDGVCRRNICTPASPGPHTVKAARDQVLGTATLAVVPSGQAINTSIATGEYSTTTYEVRSDGTVWAFGSNRYGQLGIGNTTPSTSPVKVIGLAGVQSITTDGFSAFAVKTDGTVWAWGRNTSGKLGNGTTTDLTSPVQVRGLTKVQSIVSDEFSTLALRTDGTVWAWGSNAWGELGNVGTADSLAPVQVSGLTNIQHVVASLQSAFAVKNDGTVWAWGDNSRGRLGIGNTVKISTPAQVSTLSGVNGLATSRGTTLAQKVDGTVWAWGGNGNGQLGNGTTTDSLTPVQAKAVTGVQELTTDGYSVYAVKTDGTLWDWGGNFNGQLGIGSAGSSSPSPAPVNGLSGVLHITTAGYSTYALKADGTAVAWGGNFYGQLGNGTAGANTLRPISVNLTGINAITADGSSAFAIKNDGTAWAWGFNGSGRLGTGTTGDSTLPIRIP